MSETRIAVWTALGALAATALLGVAAPRLAGQTLAGPEIAAPRPLTEPHVPSIARPVPTGRSDDSVPPSSEVFATPRTTAGSDAQPSTF